VERRPGVTSPGRPARRGALLPLRRLVLGPLLERELPPGITLPAGVEIRENRWLLALGGRLAGMRGRAGGMAIGRTILVPPDSKLQPRLLLHELVHVRQWRTVPLFPLRYLWESLRRGYRNNRFEREARDLADPSIISPETEI
jgi:hypothetical protein